MASYETPEEIARLADMDPEFAELIASTPQPSFDLTYPVLQAMRQQSLAIAQKKSDEAAAAGHEVEVRTITMRDGFESEIRIHRPQPPVERSPLVVLIYGGGFIMGTNLQWVPTARALNELFEATVVCISYRLAPEHPFPQGQHDGWDSLVWISKTAASLGADTEAGFVIGGASAGSNIAAVIAQRSLSKNEGEQLAAPLTGVWLDVPMLFSRLENVPDSYKHLYISQEQNADAPGLLNPQAVVYIRSAVKADGFSADFSPFNAEEPHVGMPPVFLQVAGMDMYRDDALIYEKALREAGVETRLKVYAGVPHGHVTLYPGLKKAREARLDTLEGFGWLLGREMGRERVGEVWGRVNG